MPGTVLHFIMGTMKAGPAPQSACSLSLVVLTSGGVHLAHLIAQELVVAGLMAGHRFGVVCVFLFLPVIEL